MLDPTETAIENNQWVINFAFPEGIESTLPAEIKAKYFEKYEQKHLKIQMKPFASKMLTINRLLQEAYDRKRKGTPPSDRSSRQRRVPDSLGRAGGITSSSQASGKTATFITHN